MLTLTVLQARQLEKGQPMPGLTGRVKVVFPPKMRESKLNEGETYSDQGIVITDLADPKSELILSFYDHPPFPATIAGKVISVIPGAKGTGLKSNGSYIKQDRQGNDQINYTAGASASCEVTFEGVAPAAPVQPPRPAPAQSPVPRAALAPAAQPVQAQFPPSTNQSWAEYLEVESAIMGMCISAACGILAKKNEAIATICGEGPTPAQVVELAVGLRMGGTKSGLTHASRMSKPVGQAVGQVLPPPALDRPPAPPVAQVAEDDVPF